jgi:hypothetical protein
VLWFRGFWALDHAILKPAIVLKVIGIKKASESRRGEGCAAVVSDGFHPYPPFGALPCKTELEDMLEFQFSHRSFMKKRFGHVFFICFRQKKGLRNIQA